MIHSITNEQEALLRFKQEIQADNCGFMILWASQEFCCWRGVCCSNRTGHVIGLYVSGVLNCYRNPGFYHLRGTLSPSPIELGCLNYLNLSHVGFQGGTPYPQANLSNLTSLDLSYNYSPFYIDSLGWLSYLTLLKVVSFGLVYLSLTGLDAIHLQPSFLK
ncbi:hypothetical protein Cgig2_013332 [Carnegiea gigantea]|uniref:Leucine-rich repeat-containing N-terminal plant-type domain-containing protein n=1 Tax=Carnegiea gigantea TaxID=171969 RepID=A0A9Q1GXJ4_9CARY|nr:hypothetical protein Cgig2_013332 [Carnegiea gigantea]